MAHTLLYRRIFTGILSAAGVLLLLSAYGRDPDPMGQWLAQCPLRAATGMLCPLCGAQGAAHAMLHGKWLHAWQANPGVVLLPLLLVAVVLSRRCAGDSRVRRRASRLGAVGVPVLVVLFAVVRNVW